jgi:U3 small nucleolar RNA-associated protein 7
MSGFADDGFGEDVLALSAPQEEKKRVISKKSKNMNRQRKEEEEALAKNKKKLKKRLNKKKQQYERTVPQDEGAAKQPVRKMKDKKLKSRVQRGEKKFNEAHLNAARAEILHSETAGYLEAEGTERTYRFKQREIKEAVDVNTANKSFELRLEDTGPYCLDYTRNGRYLALGGADGHLALIDSLHNKGKLEVSVGETIKDIKFLHNQTMFAVAQKKYAYIYDDNGIELHCLKHHIEPTRLEFLPYHFLLVSAGRTGYIKWQDTSTGELCSEARTKLGACSVLKQNPYNAVVCAGHAGGTVTMWSPTMKEPLVKMLCHRGPLTGIAVDRSGYNMVTTGMDAQMKVWDIRTFRPVHEYYTSRPASTVDISQRGIIGVGFGSYVQLWKDALRVKAKSPYLRHSFADGSAVSRIRFRPYEDICGIGHAKGFSSIIVPGSGEPNFDAFEANPYQTQKQQRESTVHALLDKLQPDMIQLDPANIGRVDRAPTEIIMKERKLAAEANAAASGKPKKEKRKARGRNKIGKRLKKKHQNIITKERVHLREMAEERRRLEKQQRDEAKKKTDGALGIFARKKKTF